MVRSQKSIGGVVGVAIGNAPLYLQSYATRRTLGGKTPLCSLGACIFKKRVAIQLHRGA